jgi:superfamily II DNA/RNA helicase
MIIGVSQAAVHTSVAPYSSVRTPHSRAANYPRKSARLLQLDDALTQTRVDYDIGIEQPESFDELGIKPSLCRALKGDNILIPTTVQYKALPLTIGHKRNCIIRSETGTGKTLTFLLPALQEQLPGLTTLILVPTRELAVQMHHQAKKLIKDSQDKNARRVMVVFSGGSEEAEDDCEQESLADTRPHILIGTPKRVLELINTEKREFLSLRQVVLDEVDKLLLLAHKRSARKQAVRERHPRPASLIVERLLDLKRRYKTQLIATSATADDQIKEALSIMGWGPDPLVVSTSDGMNQLISPDLIEHCSLPCYDRDGAEVPEGYDKLDALVNHFRSSSDKSALVFIHRNARISQFLYDLRKRGIVAEALHENCLNPSQYQQFIEDFRSGRIEMVVCTEETVRGLDFMWLSSVYLMVVPRTASEYLHLCGRVGRVGRRGRAIVILEDEKERTRMKTHYMKLKVQGRELRDHYYNNNLHCDN